MMSETNTPAVLSDMQPLSIVAPITTVEVVIKAAFPSEEGRAVYQPYGKAAVRQAGRDHLREGGIRQVVQLVSGRCSAATRKAVG